MNAGFTVMPILLLRYGLMAMIDRKALRRAAYFAPMVGREKFAYFIYQLTGLGSIVYLFFLTVKTDNSLFYAGLGTCVVGTLLYAIAIVHFAKPKKSGINIGGLYRVSRNPMYVAYFLCFLGCALMTRSMILLAVHLAFQISTHFIILAEERWCEKEFGEEYREYMRKVRRYI